MAMDKEMLMQRLQNQYLTRQEVGSNLLPNHLAC